MSAPMPHTKDKIQGALCEVVSAMSALNMHPRPMKQPEGEYLSERDEWAKHAMEHLRAVVELLNAAHSEREHLKWRIYKLEAGIASQQKLINELAGKVS